MIAHYPEFLGIVAAISLAPGPDTALVIRNAIRGGRREGLITAIGCASGLTTWAIVAAFGLLAMLRVSASLFMTIQLVGAVYLLALGVRCLVSGWMTAKTGNQERQPDVVAAERPDRLYHLTRVPPTQRYPVNALFEGLATDLLNPKAAVFFTALLPQFLRPDDPGVAAILLGLTAALGALIGLTAYALAAARASVLLRRRWPAAVLDATTGIVFLLFGAALIRRNSALTGTVLPRQAR